MAVQKSARRALKKLNKQSNKPSNKKANKTTGNNTAGGKKAASAKKSTGNKSHQSSLTALASLIKKYTEDAARCSEGGPGVTRFCYTREHAKAAVLLRAWMRDAGMKSHVDFFGNVVGVYPADSHSPSKKTSASPAKTKKTLVLGSHQDTVREGGKYDGMLGVIAAVLAVRELHKNNVRLPHEIRVVAFCDEEGARFSTMYLGSRGYIGEVPETDLRRADASGMTVSRALAEFKNMLIREGVPSADITRSADQALLKRAAKNIACYMEAHIEQGPVLQQKNMPLALVRGINASSRVKFRIEGEAGHAGTVPLALRKDPVMSFAKMRLAIDARARGASRMTATVGMLQAFPGVINVIPGHVDFSLDIRHPDYEVKEKALADITAACESIARAEGTKVSWKVLSSERQAACDALLTARLKKALAQNISSQAEKNSGKKTGKNSAEKLGSRPPELYSGAGHDVQIMASRAPAAMLFIRCKDGVSHNPAESIRYEDAARAVAVMRDFLRSFL